VYVILCVTQYIEIVDWKNYSKHWPTWMLLIRKKRKRDLRRIKLNKHWWKITLAYTIFHDYDNQIESSESGLRLYVKNAKVILIFASATMVYRYFTICCWRYSRQGMTPQIAKYFHMSIRNNEWHFFPNRLLLVVHIHFSAPSMSIIFCSLRDIYLIFYDSIGVLAYTKCNIRSERFPVRSASMCLI